VPVGPLVRRLFGPYETQIAELYRAAFVDLDGVVANVANWSPAPRLILEVGCGEGAMTQRLARQFRAAQLLAIDISPRLGRLFKGDSSRVEFRQVPVGTIADSMPKAFDLVLLCDVLHHIPRDLRDDVLADISRCLAPGGVFFLKEWLRSASPVHLAGWASDLLLTGDRVQYFSEDELRAKVTLHFAPPTESDIARVPPWRNNVVLRLTNSAQRSRG
jgi:SAM-dependent methyltransferase